MNLNEAIAVYLYLHQRGPGNRTRDEENALREAWRIICNEASEIVTREFIVS